MTASDHKYFFIIFYAFLGTNSHKLTFKLVLGAINDSFRGHVGIRKIEISFNSGLHKRVKCLILMIRSTPVSALFRLW